MRKDSLTRSPEGRETHSGASGGVALSDWLRAPATKVRTRSDRERPRVQLKPLAYEEARALTALVAEIGKQKVVLILDAWEQSPSIEVDADVFEAILTHQADWLQAHVILAIRHPEIDTT